MIAGDPYQGGAAWVVLQYVLGLQQLGYDVYLIEPLAASSVRPAGASLPDSENAAYFRAATQAFGLEGRSALLLDNTHDTAGLPYDSLRRISQQAAALLNISGMLNREELVNHIPVRVYVDLDPAFNQLWHATQGIDMRFTQHNHFVTVGRSLGRPECPIPTCGIEWRPIFPPVVLSYFAKPGAAFYRGMTTVANWRGYGSIHHDGVHYGQKAHSLRQFMDLPARSAEEFLLALSIHEGEHKDLAALRNNRWRLLDTRCIAGTPRQYLNFVSASKAEFGIAKSGYVAARCGWFSDRTACYLAAGRPVVAQETGFSAHLPCGEGLFAFRTAYDVLHAIDEINADYVRHSRAASQIAAEYFDSERVLSALMRDVGL